jgi:hypothetical protein
MKLKSIIAGLILFSSGWAGAQTDSIFPDGPVTSGTGIGIGTKRGVTVYSDLVSTVVSNRNRVGNLETSVTSLNSRVGVVETSVTQALVPETLQTVRDRGRIVDFGTTVTTTTPLMNWASTGYAWMTMKNGVIEYPSGLPAPNDKQYADIGTFVIRDSAGVPRFYLSSEQMAFGDGSHFANIVEQGGMTVKGYPPSTWKIDLRTGYIIASSVDSPFWYGLGVGQPGVLAADKGIVSNDDVHVFDSLYVQEGYGIFGPGRQDTGTIADKTPGTIFGGHAGSWHAGWFSGSTMWVLGSTTGTVSLRSRNSGDTTALGGTLAAPALRTNTTDTTVTGELWKGSARVPAVNQIVGGSYISATVTGSTVTLGLSGGYGDTIKIRALNPDTLTEYDYEFSGGILIGATEVPL